MISYIDYAKFGQGNIAIECDIFGVFRPHLKTAEEMSGGESAGQILKISFVKLILMRC